VLEHTTLAAAVKQSGPIKPGRLKVPR
jgi:hypothetical protein